jgi:catabolite repression HPr-like protein
MVSNTITVNALLNTETAARLVQAASRFNGSVTLQSDGKAANAKSIMGILSLGLDAGHSVTLTVEGGDEEAAFAVLASTLTGREDKPCPCS